MKQTLLKISRFVINFVLVIGILWSLVSFLYGVLPAEITKPIIDYLKLNAETIIPSGLSTTLTTIVIVFLKYFTKGLNLQLQDTNLKHDLWKKGIENEINERFVIQEQKDDVVIQKQNEAIKENNKTQKLLTVLLAFQKANATRNLQSKLVSEEAKEDYEKALNLMENLPLELLDPIKTIYEEVVVKEIVKEVIKPNNKTDETEIITEGRL